MGDAGGFEGPDVPVWRLFWGAIFIVIETVVGATEQCEAEESAQGPDEQALVDSRRFHLMTGTKSVKR